MATWTSVPIPPPACAARFVAHSVTAALEPEPVLRAAYGLRAYEGLAWRAVAHLRLPGPAAPTSDLLPADRLRAAEAAARHWIEALPPAGPRGAVLLSGGTLIELPPAGAPLEVFAGFARPDSEYSLPRHRFRDGARDAAAALLSAQAMWDERMAGLAPAAHAAAAHAFAALGAGGYPAPGTPSADATVTALLQRGDALVARVALGREAPGLIVLVPAQWSALRPEGEPGPLRPAELKALADEGRDLRRYDLLQPRLAAVLLRGAA